VVEHGGRRAAWQTSRQVTVLLTLSMSSIDVIDVIDVMDIVSKVIDGHRCRFDCCWSLLSHGVAGALEASAGVGWDPRSL
jgi:hypothetical protein